MAEEHYKTKALIVRSEARAKLMALREERIAKRRLNLNAKTTVQTACSIELPAHTGAAPPDSIFDPDPAGGSEAEDVLAIEDGATLDAETASDLFLDGNDRESGCVEEVPHVEAKEDEQCDAEADEAASDLQRLPGAGIGLIWMLSECGIRNLSELAEADPEALSVKLGLVGQILDVATWVTFAKAQGETRQTPATS